MNILITICARGGSKGIPGKNLKLLNGKPLIAYTISAAKQLSEKIRSTEIVLSSDDEKIILTARQYGIITDYRRPDALAGDKVGKIDAIRDVLYWKERQESCRYDIVLDLDVTSPLRTVEDLWDALNLLNNDKEALNLFSVSPANRNPYFNMVEKKENGYYDLVKKTDHSLFTRQSSPEVYDLNASFYFYRREFFDSGNSGAITPKSLIYLMPHVCFDIDHPLDFEIMEYLLVNNKLGFTI
ncbi:MAG: cytidylyltransferase domain-containing protein [Clostridiales bacterium]